MPLFSLAFCFFMLDGARHARALPDGAAAFTPNDISAPTVVLGRRRRRPALRCTPFLNKCFRGERHCPSSTSDTARATLENDPTTTPSTYAKPDSFQRANPALS